MKVISGGQTGADRAALAVAQRFGLSTGGWMPRDFEAEDGTHPDFATRYGMQACNSEMHAVRTTLNAREGNLTLWFGKGDSGGRRATLMASREYIDIPLPDDGPSPADVAARLKHVEVLNVAGHRESVQPGIEKLTAAWLEQLFEALGYPSTVPG